MSKTITVYTTNTCAYCLQVKKWLASKGLQYSEVNLDQHPERAQEMIELSGQMGVPVTLIEDAETSHKDITVGWDLPKLTEAIKGMPNIPQAV